MMNFADIFSKLSNSDLERRLALVEETLSKLQTGQFCRSDRRASTIASSPQGSGAGQPSGTSVSDPDSGNIVPEDATVITVEKGPVSEELADSVTGIIGLREAITTKHKLLKCIWAFLFCVGIGATIFFVYQTIEEYLDEPTMTRVKLQKRSEYEYPPIILCHKGWFDVNKALALNLSIDGFKYSLGYWNYRDRLNVENITVARMEFHEMYRQHNFSSLVDYYKAIAMDLQPNFSQQAFSMNPSSAYLVRDDHEHHSPPEKVFLPLQSICHRFMLKPMKSRTDLLQEPPSFLLKYIDLTQGLVPVSRNWLLFLDSTANAMYSWPLILKSEHKVILTLRTQRFINKNLPNSPCSNLDEKEYTGAACMAECGNGKQREVYNCQLFWISTGAGNRHPEEFCNSFDASVMKNVTLKADKWDVIMQKVNDDCVKKCPHRCNRILYDASLEGEDEVWSDILAAELRNSTHPNSSLTMMNIQYDALRRDGILTFTEVSSYTFTELVNNVGGTLGLFVGATLITVAQLIMFLLKRICEAKRECQDRRAGNA